jgi:hypothetical protein
MARPAMCSGDGAQSGHPLAYSTGAENRSGQIPGREHTSERDQGVDQTDGDADLAAAVPCDYPSGRFASMKSAHPDITCYQSLEQTMEHIV